MNNLVRQLPMPPYRFQGDLILMKTSGLWQNLIRLKMAEDPSPDIINQLIETGRADLEQQT